MSSDRNFGREALAGGGRLAVGLAGSIVAHHGGKKYEEGFNDAAHICKGAVSEVIDGMMARMKAGEFLSHQEQAVLAQLNELLTDMDKRLWQAMDPELARETLP